MPSEPVYFENPAALRRWFDQNADTASELVVGFMKRGSNRPSISWPEAVDEALCVGWIDSVRHRIDDQRYKIRFTPRKPGSNWSAVNIGRVAELEATGRMKAAGRAAFQRRREVKSRAASCERQAQPRLHPGQVRTFKQNAAAWNYYESLPPGYRRRVNWWVVSARQAATRQKRLALLVQACAEGRRL